MIVGENPICLSGGAAGADSQWGMAAGMAGHMVIHFSFQGHKTQVPQDEIVVLTDEQLREADPHLEKANETLKRKVPYNKPWVVNLLRRNWFQVKDTQSVYAVSHLDNGMVSGGTAWATQMFIDRFEGGECPLYLFDQKQGAWLTWARGRWSSSSFVHPPHGIWTGIGSRDLNETGKRAIRTLLNYGL